MWDAYRTELPEHFRGVHIEHREAAKVVSGDHKTVLLVHFDTMYVVWLASIVLCGCRTLTCPIPLKLEILLACVSKAVSESRRSAYISWMAHSTETSRERPARIATPAPPSPAGVACPNHRRSYVGLRHDDKLSTD